MTDLGVLHREAHVVTMREAAGWSVAWVALALAFNFGLYQYALWKLPQVPRLAVDNIFVFGALLLLTGVKILFLPEKPIEPDRNPLIKPERRFFPVTPSLDEEKFFLRREGVLYAPPLIVALVFIEFSDIIFAILGLRAMYFLLTGMVQMFHFLKYSRGVILIFVGLKMVWLNEAFGGKFPISWSLSIIGTVLALSILVSIGFRRTRGGMNA